MRVLLLAITVAAYDPENQATYLPTTYDEKADDLATHARPRGADPVSARAKDSLRPVETHSGARARARASAASVIEWICLKFLCIGKP